MKLFHTSQKSTKEHPLAGWNKGKLIGQKKPLKLKDIIAIRVHLDTQKKVRNLALFNLAIDSKLRSCDLIKIRFSDIAPNGEILKRASVIQKKTSQSVQFEITDNTRKSLEKWIEKAGLKPNDYMFPSRLNSNNHISSSQYASLVKSWVAMAGLDPSNYGTHSMRRTKPTLVYAKTKNLRAVQLLLGHTKIESTVRYLGVEVDDALELAEQVEA